MIALQATSLKVLMNQLLIGDTFDLFYLEEATIRTAVTYTIDGHINKDFFGDDSSTPPTLQPWADSRGFCFDLIKGKRTPLYFKFVLHLPPEDMCGLLSKQNVSPSSVPGESSTLLETINALVLTIKYDGTKAILTTGTSYKTFVLSKDADQLWDRILCEYLAYKGIPFEVL